MTHEHDTSSEVVDPVCGMSIAAEEAVGRVEHDHTIYHFCSPSCMEKFQADPERYVGGQVHTTPPGGGSDAVEYTCPMHPEVRHTGPGPCPKCGMALEPREITDSQVNPELVDMTRRFWTSVALTVPILAFMISEFVPGDPLMHTMGMTLSRWFQFGLATPVVLWGGWPFFERAWLSVKNRSLTCSP